MSKVSMQRVRISKIIIIWLCNALRKFRLDKRWKRRKIVQVRDGISKIIYVTHCTKLGGITVCDTSSSSVSFVAYTMIKTLNEFCCICSS